MGSLLGSWHASINWHILVHGCDLRYFTFAVLLLSLLHRWHAVLGYSFIFADGVGSRMLWDVWLFLVSAFIDLHILVSFIIRLSLHKRRLESFTALIHLFPILWLVLLFELVLLFGLNWRYWVLIGCKCHIIKDLCIWSSLVFTNRCTTLVSVCFLLFRPFEWR